MLKCEYCCSFPCKCGAQYVGMSAADKFRLAKILLAQVRDDADTGPTKQGLLNVVIPYLDVAT